MSKTLENPPETDETLDILLPDKRLVIGGEAITMRELRFGELMKFGEEIQLLADAFSVMPEEQLSGADGIDQLVVLLVQHQWAVMPMVSECCDKPLAWIEHLSLNEGIELMVVWWMANKDFFFQRRARKQLAALQAAQQQAGDTSLPSSSAPATTSETLLTTPPVS